MLNRLQPLLFTLCLGFAWGAHADRQAAAVHLDVYKTETCGCCTLWMDHMEAHGFTSTGHHPDDLGALKRELGVPARYGSCHTGVSEEGYVFEGHVACPLRDSVSGQPAGRRHWPDGAGDACR